jgi:hypothetical protein
MISRVIRDHYWELIADGVDDAEGDPAGVAK